MLSRKVQVLVKALVLLMLFSSVLLPQTGSRTYSLKLKSSIMRQVDKDSNVEYGPAPGTSFGYIPLGNVYPEYKYRSVYEVDLPSALPTGAYITDVEFIYKNSANNSGEWFNLYNIPITSFESTWNYLQIWDVTEMGTYLRNLGVSTQNIKVPVSLLNETVNKALDEGKTKLYLGFRASPEWGTVPVNSNGFQYDSLRYIYEIRVRDTIKNSSGNGKIDVSINNQPYYEVNSGDVLKLSIGTVVQLRAKEEQFDGIYFWVWNQDPNTLDNTRSKWKTIKHGSYSYSSGVIYTDTAKSSNLFSSFTAGIKKKFIINRMDKTEFEGNFQTNDVARVVEQNSINISYPETLTKTTGTYNFAGWLDGGGTLRTPTDNATYTALYKIPNKSNTLTALSNTSQRKFIKSDNGYLHLVYESMNHIWYERSTDNGLNWQIMNGGKYLDQGATESKLPSITTINDNIAIVWQEEYVGYYRIMLARFDENSVLRYTTVVYDPAGEFADKPLYSTSADPVIAFNAAATVLVCWKKEIPGNPEASGIWYKLGQISVNPNGTISDDSRWYQEDIIPGTTMNSYTPTLTLSFPGQEFALAWEQREYYGSIKFARLSYGASNGVYIVNNISQETVSNWSYYQKHSKPSIAIVNQSSVGGSGKLELGWVGERTYYENGVQKVMKNALYRRDTYSTPTNTWNWGGTTWSMGSNVSAVNVNTTTTDGVVGWNEGCLTNRYIKTSNPYSTRIFNTGPDLTGSSLQINNSTDFNSMYALVFKNTSLPYSFTKSFSVQQLGKTGPNATSSRIAIARLDSAAFFISLSRLSLEGKNIGFTLPGDDIMSYNVKSIEEALSTESFTPEANSSICYDIEFGALDTLYSMKALLKGAGIHCRLELQDMANGSTLKILEKFSLDRLTMKGKDGSLRNTSGTMDLRQFAGRNLRLRLVIEDGINAYWGLMERVLSPEEEKEIEKITQKKVMDYALSQNYPNPFNPSTLISYEIPKTSKVTLKIYDMLGKEVATLVDEVKGEGRYSVEFNASGLPSGIYIYEICVNDFVKSGKMMLLK